MKNLIRHVTILAILVLGFKWPTADAHDLVLIPTGPQSLTLEFGHPAEYRAPDPERLIRLNAWMAGDNQPTSIISGLVKSPADHSTLDLEPFSAGHAVEIIWGQYDNGYWVTLPGDKHLNTSKVHMPNATDSGAFFKFGKVLFPVASADATFGRRLGEQLEIVPVADPFQVHPGQKLPVTVLYEGRPVAGIGVEIGDGKTQIKEEDIPRYKTDSQGIARLPIDHGGLQVIAVDYRTPPLVPRLSDHDDYGACLVYFLPERRN